MGLLNSEVAPSGDVRVAVNLSIRQFREPDLVDTVEAVLGETGLAPERLEIEVTEAALMGDGGIQECGYAQNCVEVCPKDIPLTRSISEVGRDVMKQAIGDLFRR